VRLSTSLGPSDVEIPGPSRGTTPFPTCHLSVRLPAVEADLLSRFGRTVEAASAHRQALALAANQAERAFLAEQIDVYTRPS
jgi:hypothetical protein